MTGRLIIGDALTELRRLEAESVHCCICSPPYWGLRDYGEPGQLGLEPTPEEHVAAMVGVFEEVRRVLRSDGTLWLNYGDSYAGSTQSGGKKGLNGPANGPKHDNHAGVKMDVPPGLKPKDLVGMPWRIAFALQAAGWYLRSDIIWHKPNPMPESVTDRPTSAHEYLFLLAKSARYYYDADAIREAAQDRPQPQPEDKVVYHGAMSVGGNNAYAKGASGYGHNPAGRNKRTVWTVATQPYSGAHFATFPPKLITPCIMAGTSERGCCSSCGAPWVRVVERKGYGSAKGQNKHDMTCNEAGARNRRYARLGGGQAQREVETTGWRPSCTCDAEAVPCTVLDPFGGSGTTAEVAEALGRRWILIELSPTYAELARRRTAQQGLFSR